MIDRIERMMIGVIELIALTMIGRPSGRTMIETIDRIALIEVTMSDRIDMTTFGASDFSTENWNQSMKSRARRRRAITGGDWA